MHNIQVRQFLFSLSGNTTQVHSLIAIHARCDTQMGSKTHISMRIKAVNSRLKSTQTATEIDTMKQSALYIGRLRQ